MTLHARCLDQVQLTRSARDMSWLERQAIYVFLLEYGGAFQKSLPH